MAKSRTNLTSELKAKYPKLFIKDSEEFDGTKGGLWLSGENGDEAENGLPLFNYYTEDHKEVNYVLGVHREIGDYLSANGWFAEWHDAGTIMLFED